MSNSHSPVGDSPSSSRERSPKRRRLSDGYASPNDDSLDELATPTRNSVKPRPHDRQSTKPFSQQSAPDDSIQRTVSRQESPDELDHTFFSRTGQPQSQHALSEHSEAAESEDGYPASSPVLSPAPQYYPEQVHYKPRLVLRGHKRGVAVVKFSPDGKWIASCCKP